MRSNAKTAEITSIVGEAVKQASAALDEGQQATRGLSQSIAAQVVRLTKLWENYERRFVKIDEDLERAFEKLAQETTKQSQLLAEQTIRIDRGLAGAVDKLAGPVQGIGDGAQELSETVGELKKLFDAGKSGSMIAEEESADHSDESVNYFVPMTDMMVGVLFIFILMLMAFALDFRRTTDAQETALKVAQEVASKLDPLQSAVREQMARLDKAQQDRRELLQDIRTQLAKEGLSVQIDEASGVLRLNEDAVRFASEPRRSRGSQQGQCRQNRPGFGTRPAEICQLPQLANIALFDDRRHFARNPVHRGTHGYDGHRR